MRRSWLGAALTVTAGALALSSCVPPAPVAKPPAVIKPTPSPIRTTPPPSPSGIPDWTGYKADAAQTGSNPLETRISGSTVGRLRQVWHASPLNPASAFSDPPIVAGGLAYLSSSTSDRLGNVTNVVGAYDVETGRQIWLAHHTSLEHVVGAADGLVFVEDQNTYPHSLIVHALNGRTGKQVWSWTSPADNVLPTGQSTFTAAGHLFVPLTMGDYALDPRTGRQLFVVTCDDPSDGIYCPFDVGRGVAASATRLFAGGWAASGEMLDATNGARLAPFFVAAPGVRMGAPLVGGSRVFEAASFYNPRIGVLGAFQPGTCHTPSCPSVWRDDLPDGVVAMAYENNLLYVLSDSTVREIAPATGAVLWQADIPLSTVDGYSNLSVAGNVVYATATADTPTDGRFRTTIYAFPSAGCAAKTGCQPLWHVAEDDKTAAPPVITGGRLLYADDAGLHALALS